MPGIHSDHRLLKFSIINYTKHKTGNRFWKFNTSLLYNHEYITNIKNIIKSTTNTYDHNYAKRYITFNAKKSQVIIYKAYNVKPPDPCVVINGAPVKYFNNVIHLGHLLTENVYEFNVSKCIDDFNRQCNMFFADFKHCSCHMRNILFQRYCTNFYGSQLLPFFDVKTQELYIAWRIAVHRV